MRCIQYALEDPLYMIAIDDTKYAQPDLFRVNRRIRREALPNFYDSNEFMFSVERCIFPSPEHWVSSIPSSKINGLERHRPDWKNLRTWLKGCYEGPVSLRDIKQPIFEMLDKIVWKKDRVVIQQAFRVVGDLKHAGVTWSVVDQVLTSFEEAVESRVTEDGTGWARSSEEVATSKQTNPGGADTG